MTSRIKGNSILNSKSNLLTVSHYAGDVEYNTDSFLEKNNDSLVANLVYLTGKSKGMLFSLFQEERDLANKSAGRLKVSLCKKFNSELKNRITNKNSSL